MKKLPQLIAGLCAVLLVTFGFAGTASAQDATITLLHGIPDTDVDVEVAGENVIEGFSFGDTEDLSSFAGQTLSGLKVKAAGTDTVAIDAGDVALPASGNYSVIAHLDAEGTPALGVFENDTSAIGAGQGRLVVRHTAAAPAVDVRANGEVAFSNLSNPNEAMADLAAGTVSADVVPTGASEPVVIGPTDITIAEGQSLIIYAVGSLDDESLTVLTQNIQGLGSAPSAVETGNSPVSDTDGIPAVLIAGAVLLAMASGGFIVARAVRA